MGEDDPELQLSIIPVILKIPAVTSEFQLLNLRLFGLRAFTGTVILFVGGGVVLGVVVVGGNFGLHAVENYTQDGFASIGKFANSERRSVAFYGVVFDHKEDSIDEGDKVEGITDCGKRRGVDDDFVVVVPQHFQHFAEIGIIEDGHGRTGSAAGGHDV